MKCPRCKVELTRKMFENHPVDACGKCGGLWVHRHQLNELLDESHGDVESSSIDSREHKDKFPAAKCLSCDNRIMKKINFMEFSDIIIDYCPGCGSFWIDGQELDMMHDYIRRIEEGSHLVKDRSAYSILARLSQIAYRIYH